MSLTLSQIASILDSPSPSDPDRSVMGIATLNEATEDEGR